MLVLALLLFEPTLGWLLRTWQVHPYYSHGPILPLLAAALLWHRRERLRAADGSDWGLALLAGAVGIHLAALRWEAWPVSALALIPLLAGALMLSGGRPALRGAAFPMLLLALAVPLPFVEHLAPPLAAGAAKATAGTALVLGIPVQLAGAQLSVADGAFVVGAPCSGLRSMMALFSLAVVVAGLMPGLRLARLALVALAVPLALLANGARLLGLLWAAHSLGADRALAFFHGPSSPIFFGLALLVMLGLASLVTRAPDGL